MTAIDVIGWSLAAVSVAGNVFVIKRRALGFWLWAVANAGWIAIDLRAALWPQAALFAVYLALAVKGARDWRRL